MRSPRACGAPARRGPAPRRRPHQNPSVRVGTTRHMHCPLVDPNGPLLGACHDNARPGFLKAHRPLPDDGAERCAQVAGVRSRARRFWISSKPASRRILNASARSMPRCMTAPGRLSATFASTSMSHCHPTANDRLFPVRRRRSFSMAGQSTRIRSFSTSSRD